MDVLLPRGGSRPFGPLPPAAVALYGVLLGGAGLTLCFRAGNLNGYWAAGIIGFVLGVACILLAARAERRPRRAALALVPDAPAPTDPKLAAARLVSELEDLRRQLDAPLDVDAA
jgi:hypothetical protein